MIEMDYKSNFRVDPYIWMHLHEAETLAHAKKIFCVCVCVCTSFTKILSVGPCYLLSLSLKFQKDACFCYRYICKIILTFFNNDQFLM